MSADTEPKLTPATDRGSERLLARYRIDAEPAAIEARAIALAIEQSVEMPPTAICSRELREQIVGRVEGITATDSAHGPVSSWQVDISLAVGTTGCEPGQLMNMLFGNCSLQEDVRLLDAQLPRSLLDAMPGPALGIDGLRACLDAPRRALSCTALKPQGLSGAQLATLAGRFARAGIDLIKDDHGIADQRAAPFVERVRAVQSAVDAANRETGGRTIYAPNISGGPAQIERQLGAAREAGVRALLACPMLIGIPVFAQLARDSGAMALIAHPALAGISRIAPPLLLGRLFRLFGADASIFPNFGGRFSYTRTTCEAIARAAREPLGSARPCLPVPAGGMRVDRVDEMIEIFGRDTMLLIGGNLLEAGPALEQRAAEFVRKVHDARPGGGSR